MNKVLYSLAVIVAMICTACDHYDHAIADQGDRLDVLEQSTIKNIDEQVDAIKTSLVDLETLAAELEALVESLETEDDENAALIAALQAKDAELDEMIEDLKTYVDEELEDVEDWANQTFATLEMYSSMQEEIAAIKTSLETNNTTTQAIEEAIQSSEASMKNWVNTTLADGYYNIATIDAKLTELEEQLTEADEDLKEQIEGQQEALEQAKTDLTLAYETAITTAIEDNNGVISQEIADAVNAANEEVDAKLQTINDAITAINAKLAEFEETLANLLNRIQSVRFLPEYSDGKVEISLVGTTDLTFIVSPKAAATALADAFAIKNEVVTAYVSRTKTRTKAVDMPTPLTVTSVTGDADGILEVAVIADELPEGFWDDSKEANIFIAISDGNNDIISEMIPVFLPEVQETVQDALDNAVDGSTIRLVSGLNYGTLIFRANPGHSNTVLEDIADAWAYNYNRSIENVTIIGAPGAKVDAIRFETGALPGDCNNRVTVKNLVIDGVEFTDALTASAAGYNAPVMITTSNATVDGLTVKNCKLVGNNDRLNLVYLYGAAGSKNVTITGNTVDGVARLCELRGTENVTITGNTIKNTTEHGMLLADSGYRGNVTITGNTADSINERFVRMSGAKDAVVVIEDNTITNYLGADTDYIKVTDGTDVTVKDNVLNVSTSHELTAAFNVGGKAVLLSDVVLENSVVLPAQKSLVFDLNGKTLSQEKDCTESYSMICNKGDLTITGNGKITFEDLSNGGDSSWGSYVIENRSGALLTVENGTIEHLGTADDDHDTSIPIQNYAGKVVINGGVISSPEFRSLRDFTAGGEIVINGGEFKGQVWMQGLGAGSSLVINGGSFSPTSGYDGSSVYVTNGTNDVSVTVEGGYFSTRIGVQSATQAGVVGSIKGGVFTTSAKEGTAAALLAEDYEFVDNGDETWTVQGK